MQDRWQFDEGQEIWPGRRALAPLASSSRYETWLAFDERLLSVVVVKIVRPHRIEERHVVGDLEREGETLARLSHPGVLRVFDIVMDGPRPHLVLEHLEGPTLRALLRRYGALGLEQILPLALHLCSVLHYLGTEDLVHLDVKPENVIMAAPPRLIDFSISRDTKEAARLTDVLGTYAYMAPEQARPQQPGEIGTATDMWGLGMILYPAATGRSPFDPLPDAIDPSALPQVTQMPAYIAEDVPNELFEVILDCLDPNPAARPAPLEVSLRLEPLIARLPRLPILRRSARAY